MFPEKNTINPENFLIEIFGIYYCVMGRGVLNLTYLLIFAHVSFNVTVLLKTRCSGVESLSQQK